MRPLRGPVMRRSKGECLRRDRWSAYPPHRRARHAEPRPRDRRAGRWRVRTAGAERSPAGGDRGRGRVARDVCANRHAAVGVLRAVRAGRDAECRAIRVADDVHPARAGTLRHAVRAALGRGDAADGRAGAHAARSADARRSWPDARSHPAGAWRGRRSASGRHAVGDAGRHAAVDPSADRATDDPADRDPGRRPRHQAAAAVPERVGAAARPLEDQRPEGAAVRPREGPRAGLGEGSRQRQWARSEWRLRPCAAARADRTAHPRRRGHRSRR